MFLAVLTCALANYSQGNDKVKYSFIALVLCGCSHAVTPVPATPSSTAASTVNDDDARLRAACLIRLEQRLKEPRDRLEKTKAAVMESKKFKEACVKAVSYTHLTLP